MLFPMAKATISFIISVLWFNFLAAFGQDLVSDGSCTALTKKTPTGSALLQSASTRARLTIDSERTPRAHQVAQNTSNISADRKRSWADIGSGEHFPFTGEDAEFNRSFILHAAADVATSVFTHGSDTVRAAVEHLSWPRWSDLHTIDKKDEVEAARDDAGMLILTCVFLAVLGAIAFWLVQQMRQLPLLPPASRLLQEPPPEVLAQQTFTPIVYQRGAPQTPRNRSPAMTAQVPQGYANKPLDQGREIGNHGVSTTAPVGGGARPPSPRSPRLNSLDAPFCAELIVPQQSECILLMPVDAERRSSSFNVTDVNGNIVLRVVPEPPTFGRLWRATIQTANGERLGECCEANHQASSGAAREFQLLRAGGDTYAKMRHSPAQDRFLLTLVNGTALHFWGNFETHSVNFTDEKDRLFATTETGVSAEFDPRGNYCRLRVAPLVDVGLTLCGLLCIGQHVADQKRKT